MHSDVGKTNPWREGLHVRLAASRRQDCQQALNVGAARSPDTSGSSHDHVFPPSYCWFKRLLLPQGAKLLKRQPCGLTHNIMEAVGVGVGVVDNSHYQIIVLQ